MGEVTTAVVLAGGEGLRLRPLTDQRPKAMIHVAGKPIMEWIMKWLVRNNISHVVVGVAYKKEVVIEYLKALRLDVNLNYSEHTVEGGTGEGFRLAIDRYVRDNVFLALNGDELTDIQVSEFADFHLRNGGLATIAVSRLRSPFGIVEVDGDKVRGFTEKPVLNSYLVSTGVYIFDHKILDFLPERGSIENETLPQLAARGLLRAYKHRGFWGTINTVKDLQEVERQLLKLRSFS